MSMVLMITIGHLSTISPVSAQQPSTDTLTVSAGAGLKPVMAEIQKAYKQQQPNINAIGEPRSVPLGSYAEEVFKYFGISEQLKPKLVHTRSALEILNFVEIGNVDAGIVHDTNAKQSKQVRIAEIAPQESHSPVMYPVAVLKNSKNSTAARTFVEFLFSSPLKALYEKYGYTGAQ